MSESTKQNDKDDLQEIMSLNNRIKTISFQMRKSILRPIAVSIACGL